MEAYRPLCLLNVLGKLFEQLIVARLKKEVEESGDLSEQQYGFREGRSTINALESVKATAEEARQGPYSSRQLCVLITVDVENAFNSAPWEGILKELRDRRISPYLYNIVASYFEDRMLIVGNKSKMQITGGVPQGSVLGPTLWNIYYDGVFRLPMPLGVKLIGYADDLAITVTARNAEKLEEVAESSLLSIVEWMKRKQLRLAPQKTGAVLLVGGRKTKNINIRLGDVIIQSQNSLRYLGIYLDRNMTMGVHIRRTAEKAGAALTNLCRLMPNFGGPQESSRRLLGAAVQSIMLYGASIWRSALERSSHERVYTSIQRRMAIRIISAYRTTSTKALLVLARTPPIHLLIKQRLEIEKSGRISREDAYNGMINAWQATWEENEERAQWTKKLIKDIRPWLVRKHGQLNYYLSQFFTGHGCFKSYLCRFGLSESDDCTYCGKEDTAEHTFFECPRWTMQQTRIESEIGKLTLENIVKIMLEKEENWGIVEEGIREVLSQKEEDERSRQNKDNL